MLLQFPTGSQPDEYDARAGDPNKICGCIYFSEDLSWRLILTDEADEYTSKRISETVDYFIYALKDIDLIRQYHEHKKEDKNRDIEEWRKKNIKLVEEILE